MKYLLVVVIVLIAAAGASAHQHQVFPARATYAIRQLRPFPVWVKALGLTPLPVDIAVHSTDNLQTKYNAASCGDSLVLDAGATWDTADVNTAFVFNKVCTSALPLTIKSSALASLPTGRVGPANATNMARLRAKGQEGLINFNTSGAYHILDGLELTNTGADTVTEMINILIVATDPSISHLTIQHCYIHPKETGTDYSRSVMQGMYFNGSFLTFKWNYASGFLGRFAAGDTGVNTNRVILCVTCNNLTITDSFLQAWYTAVFTGGGQEDPEYTATVTSGSLSSGTFSATTGLAAGRYIRFSLTGTMTITGSAATCNAHFGGADQNDCRTATQSAGTTINTGDIDHSIWLTPTGGGTAFRGRISTVSGGVITMAPFSTATSPNGTYTYELFEVANVTSVAGSTVNYSPIGINALNHSPDSGGTAAWRVNQVVHDITITQNTFDIDYDHARAEHDLSNQSPKGWVEFKAGDTILFEGNQFTGYVSTLGFGQYSNEGTTPWTKLKNLTVRSNWCNSVPSVSGSAYEAARAFITGHLTDTYNTTEPGGNLTVTNNLVLAQAVLLMNQAFATTTVTHNTIINDQNPDSSLDFYPSLIFGIDVANPSWVFKDNIGFSNDSNFNCQVSPGTVTTCWPGISILNNVIINNYGQSTGYLQGQYTTNGILLPIPTSITGVGFVNAGAGTVAGYALSGSSSYKNAATDGTDPGINATTLAAALSSSGGGSSITVCKWSNAPSVCQ